LTSINQTDFIDDWIEKFPSEKRVVHGGTYLALKRLMDLAAVVLLMPFWLPVFLLIALLIKLQSPDGSAIFAQKRIGKAGKAFRMYKFRTMVPDAEALKQKYAHLNEVQWPAFKITNDPRVTPIGKILRKTSLDELPQLWNVLKGEMSLVGPRPTSFGLDTYQLWHTERLDVSPGLTGLWQIVGRGTTGFDDWLRLDIAYIDRRSLWLDINILFKTITAVFEQRGAV